ncbi:MAG: hypothetical protein ACTSSI_09400 [Candidatus Helarchaeota archaeon]
MEKNENFTFRPIKPINWEELADFFRKNWRDPYHFKVGAYNWDVAFTKWTISQYLRDEDLLVGMYDSSKLIGLVLGSPCELKVQLEGEEPIMTKSVAMYILHSLMNFFIDHVKNKGQDLITSFALKSWEKVLQKHGFSYIHKDPQFFVKFLSKSGVDVVRKTRGLNVALAALAKTLAGIPKASLPFGKIRDGSPNDAGQILELLNGYQTRLQISEKWKLQDLQRFLEAGLNYFKTLEPPEVFAIKLWESDQGDLLAAMIYTIRKITFQKGAMHVCFTEFLVYDEKVMETDHKKAFLVEVLSALPEIIPVSMDYQPYNDLKARKSVKYDGDRDKRRFYVLPLTDVGNRVLELRKIKEFFLTRLEL